MPRNGSGQFLLPPATNPVVPDTIISTGWANPTLADIANALSTSIATDGQTVPTANLPMGGKNHTNVGQAQTLTQYARADQVQGWTLNIVAGVAADVTGTKYTGTVPFGIGNGAVAIPTLMPILFVPSVSNGGPSTLALNGGAEVTILNQNLTQLSVGQIKAGRPYALAFLAGNWILVTNTIELTQLNGLYLQLAGGTMSGAIVLPDPPALPTHAANRAYVDAAVVGGTAGVASFNTRTGAVTQLSSDITNALTYTPANKAGEAFGGAISAPGSSTFTRIVTTDINTLPVTPATTGAVSLDASAAQNVIIPMTGNITLTITNPPSSGNIMRFMLFNTTGRTVTWPPSTLWPLPLSTAPVLDAGPQKFAVVVLAWSGAVWVGNAAVY
jgi:hypothetical protein